MLDWDRGVPHREGAWTFTTRGTSRRAPFPGLDGDERTRHQGELVYPDLVLGRLPGHDRVLLGLGAPTASSSPPWSAGCWPAWRWGRATARTSRRSTRAAPC